MSRPSSDCGGEARSMLTCSPMCWVNACLVVTWAVTGVAFFWPIFPLLGWGIGVAFNAWDVYRPPISEDRIRREMDRLG